MAPRDPKEPLAGLIGRALAHDAVAGDPCLEPELLAAYFERSLDADEAARCELHLSQCAHCREQFAALSRASESLVPGERKGEQSAGWAGLWNWRMLAPALAVLTVAAGVWYFQHAATRTAERASIQPLVAMNQAAPSAPEPTPEAGAPTRSAASPAVSPAKQAGTPDFERTRRVAEQRDELADREAISSNLELSDRSKMDADAIAKSAAESKRTFGGFSGGVAAPMAAPPSARPESAAIQPPPPTVTASAAAGELAAPAQTETDKKTTDSAVSSVTVAEPEAAKLKELPKTGNVISYNALSKAATVMSAAGRFEETTLIRTPNPKVMWRLGGGGFVDRSEDGGATWRGQSPDPSAHLTAGSAPAAKICWLAGRGGVILLTRNAKTWMTIPPPVAADFVAIEAKDTSAATVVAADGRKFVTVDAGKSWTTVQ